MEFGKTSDLSAVDFSLPDDPPVNSRILGGAGVEGPVEFYLGATGWIAAMPSIRTAAVEPSLKLVALREVAERNDDPDDVLDAMDGLL